MCLFISFCIHSFVSILHFSFYHSFISSFLHSFFYSLIDLIIYTLIHLFSNYSNNSYNHLFIPPSVHNLLLFICASTYLFIRSIHQYICLFTRLFTYCFNSAQSFIFVFVNSCICFEHSFIRDRVIRPLSGYPFARSFIYIFIVHSFIHSFIPFIQGINHFSIN